MTNFYFTENHGHLPIASVNDPLKKMMFPLPAVSTPFLPALPIICLYVRKSISWPWNTGVRIKTRRAGRFTPDDRVDVAIKTLRIPCLKAPSTMSRSSNVKPGNKNKYNFVGNGHDHIHKEDLTQGHLTPCVLMNSSIRSNTMGLGWFLVYIKGS